MDQLGLTSLNTFQPSNCDINKEHWFQLKINFMQN